jgi:hypothetical protein
MRFKKNFATVINAFQETSKFTAVSIAYVSKKETPYNKLFQNNCLR